MSHCFPNLRVHHSQFNAKIPSPRNTLSTKPVERSVSPPPLDGVSVLELGASAAAITVTVAVTVAGRSPPSMLAKIVFSWFVFSFSSFSS